MNQIGEAIKSTLIGQIKFMLGKIRIAYDMTNYMKILINKLNEK